MCNFTFKKFTAFITAAIVASSLCVSAFAESSAPIETTMHETSTDTTTSATTALTTTAATTSIATTTQKEAVTTVAATTADTSTTAEQSVTEDEGEENIISEDKGFTFIPNVESNVSDRVNLSELTINNVNISLDNDTLLSEILLSTSITYCPYNNTTVLDKDFTFVGGMFGIQNDINDKYSFSDTQLSVEVTDENNNIVSYAALDENKFSLYKVVGIRSSDYYVSDDYEVAFCKGVKVGTTKEELVEKLGEGTVVNDMTIYRNTSHTMVVEFKNDIIKQITLLNNVDLTDTKFVGLSDDEELPVWYETPYADGMLSDDDLYNYVMNFLDDDVNLDTQGSAVLIGEDIINKDKDNEQAEEKFTSGEKIMYSIAASDGSIFYVVIDKGANGENVYFLNAVDVVDLASLIKDDEEGLSSKEEAIINQASGSTQSDNKKTSSDIIPNSNTANNTTSNEDSEKSNNSTLYIIIGVVAVGAIIAGWYFKMGPGKKNKAVFDEAEEDEDEEEYYEEAEEELDEVPAEESYDEEDNM